MNNQTSSVTAEADRRNTMIKKIFEEALDRVLKGEDQDPCMALCVALLQCKLVEDVELEVILEAHNNGPWVIDTLEKFAILSKYCDLSGSPIDVGKSDQVYGIQVYRENFGDCCLQESVKGKTFAVWTRKGRLHIGFRYPAQAAWFRDTESQLYSMEYTGNKRVALVVLEGGDNLETIKTVAERLQYLPLEM